MNDFPSRETVTIYTHHFTGAQAADSLFFSPSDFLEEKRQPWDKKKVGNRNAN